ncbi:hypothetical protein PG993_000425 [Apiospora rasikravindrae]|uniref:Major facilitator superfamily (MFS) profile domain-containing protein n=1 Tax=Apiospora rasikravindrae TaxID=990691 RepID=A0ABR1U8I0_9PEZI
MADTTNRPTKSEEDQADAMAIQLALERALESSKDVDHESAGVRPVNRKPTSKRTAFEITVLMATLCSAVFLAALDITIVSTALPTISDEFQSTSAYTWVGSAFLLAAAVVSPTWAKFSDVFGRRSVLLLAIAVFFVGSALSGASVSPGHAPRRSRRPGRRGRGLAGSFGMIWAIAFTLGPLIGGAFTQNVSWRWSFYVNLPISGTSFVIIIFMLKLETPKTPFLAGIKAIDWLGSLVLVGGLLMFLLALNFGGATYPWDSAVVICLLVFGVFCCGLFVPVERYLARFPLIPIHLYASQSNVAILTVNLCHGIILTLNTYFLPLYCQSVLGSSPLLSGVLLLPFAVSMSVSTVGVGTYLRRTGRYMDCIWLGFAVLATGNGLQCDLPGSKVWSKVILYTIVSGFGIGLLYQPPLIALQSNLPRQENASATASFALVRNLASAVGVVVGSVIFTNEMDAQRDTLVSALGPQDALLFSGGSAQANVLLVGTLGDGQRTVVRHAYWTALRGVWIAAVSFAAAGGLACLFIRHRLLDTLHVEVKTGLAGEEERRKIARQEQNSEV